jgi:hypothetical protein
VLDENRSFCEREDDRQDSVVGQGFSGRQSPLWKAGIPPEADKGKEQAQITCPADLVEQELSMVQKRLRNDMLIRERLHTEGYPVMPIFSRRYLSASRDVVTEVGFK